MLVFATRLSSGTGVPSLERLPIGFISSRGTLLPDMIPASSRKSKIRPPRKSNVSSDAGAKGHFDYASSWTVIANAIVQIQNKNVSNLSYEQLYRIAYTLVLQKLGGRLYEDVSALIGEHLRTKRKSMLALLDDSLNSGSEEFLKAVVNEWMEHLQSMKFISDVLMYLNRVYVKEYKKLLIYDLGIVSFEVNFLRYNDMEIAIHLIKIVIDEIAKSRTQAISTRSYLIKTIAMFEIISEERVGSASSIQGISENTNLYRDTFERDLLQSSEKYFSVFAEESLSSLSGTKYLHDVYALIKEEEARLQSLSNSGAGTANLLRSETYPKMLNLMNRILIKEKLEQVMLYPAGMEGLQHWLEPVLIKSVSKLKSADIETVDLRDHICELRILYELEGRVDPERKRLKVRMRDTIVAQGSSIPDAVLGSLEQSVSLSVANGSKKQSVTFSSTSFVVAWIDTILEYQQQMSMLAQDAFNSDHTVEFTIFASIKQFINSPSSRVGGKVTGSTLNAAELLSVYIDHHIKHFSKPTSSKRASNDGGINIDETEEFFQKIITFLKLIEDKYAFEAHYAAHFAKRFLNSKGSSSSSNSSGGDIEELVLAKLWEEVFMGSHYLERIIKMKKDVKSSAELTAEWKRFSVENSLSVTELELKLCSLSDWPKSMTKDYKEFANIDGEVGIIWPKQLRETMRTFEEFWLTGKRNDNKALFWYPKFGQMDLRITYPSRTYDINLSTYGGVIMMLFAPQSTGVDGELVSAFDEQRELTYKEILELTKIPEFDLKRQLKSIAVAPRSRLLTKIPMSKDINEEDRFMLNSKFKSPTAKVKVLTVKSDSSKDARPRVEDKDEVQASIDEGRKHLINAAIVRTMKSRQTVKHNELIEEIIKQLQNRFLPAMIHIKQRIEDLIEKEYLRRDANSPNIYHYIA